MKNSGQRNTLESSLAKWYSTEAAVKAASDAVQIHGAYGYSDEFDVERFLRNARGGTIYEGTSEIHTLLQAEFALGVRSNPALRRELPAYDPATWQREPPQKRT
jgi:alkylation response protein AidB-like acyl-CoA dehydrogenase